MHYIKKITDNLTWVGANDRRLAMFEGVYSVPRGVSYNSYLIKDEKTVLFDTVDKTVKDRFLENLFYALGGKNLDYLIVQHTEPDHSSAVKDLLRIFPDMRIVCNQKTHAMLNQFNNLNADARFDIVKEGDVLTTGRHELHFVMAPMVHWPEVMVTYDSTDKILFSADGFGSFGATNGAMFADEVDFAREYMDEARRYYSNIVGKYGTQVAALLKKASALKIEIICPLHGFVWRKNLGAIISKYILWSEYIPEESGVVIAYASVYGNTENAAEILAGRLNDSGIKVQMFDVSVTHSSEIVSAAFRWSHLVFASTTYNAGIFVMMESLLNDLTAHCIKNRTVAVIENGSWAAASGGLIREKISGCKNINILENSVSIKSGLKERQLDEIHEMADAIAFSITGRKDAASVSEGARGVDAKTMFKLSYGLFVLTAKDGEKDNGCIINTAAQITDAPLRITITVNKANLTHDIIAETKEFNVSILSESAPFSVFEKFGFVSGRNVNKFDGIDYCVKSANGILFLNKYVNGVISGKVTDIIDFGSHSQFVAEVTGAFGLSNERSLTYAYYFEHVKPKPQPAAEKKNGFVCTICGYVYEGDSIPEDFICPLCKHGARDFEPLSQ